MEKIYKNASWDATKIIIGSKALFFICSMFMVGTVWGQSTANYAFTFGSSSLNSMTGSTSLMTGVQDDLGSTVFPIGFNFIYMGNVYTHISVNSNGQARLHTSSGATALGSSAVSSYAASTVTLAPMAGDNEVGNGMSYLVTGSAPNRKLIIEWNNFYAYYTDISNSGNMQLVLYEGTGVFQYIYGNIINSQSIATTRSIFHSSNNTANASAFVTVAATPTVNTSATSPTTNSFVASVAIANLANRMFTFTPTVTSIAGPTNLTFASVTATGMTLNWTAASPTTGIVRYIVQRSTDGGITYPVSTNVALGTNTLAVTGLTPGTNYTYRVVAVSEGVESAAITGSQTTTAGATYYWVGASGGLWGTAANWNTAANGTGTTRSSVATTDVLIVDGASTTAGGSLSISVDVASFSIGQLKITSNTALTLASSAATTRTITITGGGGDDFVIENGSSLTTNSSSNAIGFAFSGTGNTGDISGTYTFGGSTANIMTTTGGTSTVVTVSSTGAINNSIPSNVGCLTGSAATLIFANGSSYTQSTFTTTALIPLATWGASSNITMNGASTTAPTFTNIAQTFGNISFILPSLTATTSVWTTNTAIIQGNLTITVPTAIIFRALTSGSLTINGNVNINGGIFQHTNSTATLTVLGNTTIASGATLDLSAGSGTYSQRGSSFTNNGTLIGGGTTTGSTLQMFSPSNAAMTFAGTGTVSTALTTLSVQSTSGLTISHTNQIPVLRTNLFTGTVTNSNKITMGTGAALAVTFQTGSAGSTNNGGTFDQSPTWNLGTGTYSLIYSQELGKRTTGFEIPPTRTVNNITNSNSNGLTINGGALSSAALTLSSGCGNITTSSANILRITGTTTSAITRTSTTAYINGPLELTLPASLTGSSVYLFPIGKSLLKPFELTTPITTAGGTVVVRAEVFDGNSGGTAGNIMGSISANRYWEASIISGAANYTSSHIRLTDTTTGFDAIGGSITLTGAYDLIGGSAATVSATSITTVTPVPTTLLGFYCMGAKAAATLSNLTISPSGNLCTNAVRDITVTATPGGGAVTGVTLNYSINGVAQTAINMTNTSGNDWTGQIPVVSPTNANVTWSVTATDANSLTKSATGTAYKDEPNFGATATATASPSTLCTGSNTNLSYSVSSLGTGVIGSGSTNSSSSPTPFSGSYGGMKGQYIILASELTAAGYSAGNITSIGINFASATTVTYTDLTIQIGNTSLTAFNSTLSLESGLTTVYGPTSLVNPPAGVLLFNLVSPFNWNGTSNIIISTSWSNNATTSTSASVVTTTTSTNLAQVHKRDSYTPAALLALTGTQSAGSSTVGTARPNFTLIGNKSLAPSSYSWSDGSATIGNNQPAFNNCVRKHNLYLYSYS
jgi:hypothetical protein